MKNIYEFSEIDILKADGCTQKEAEKHLKNGATIYSPEDYFSMLKDFPEIAEEFGIFELEQVIKKCENNETSGDTDFTEYKGIPCVIEYIL